MYKWPGSDHIPAELIQSRGEILRSKIHKLISYIWNKQKLPDQWKKSIIVPVHKKGDKTDCSNCRGMSLLSTSYKILFSIFLSKLRGMHIEYWWESHEERTTLKSKT
jgi:hypothetical protein